MKRKADKIEETAAIYQTSSAPVKPEIKQDGQVHYIDPETAQALMDKIFKEHDELFRKLAQ